MFWWTKVDYKNSYLMGKCSVLERYLIFLTAFSFIMRRYIDMKEIKSRIFRISVFLMIMYHKMCGRQPDHILSCTV